MTYHFCTIFTVSQNNRYLVEILTNDNFAILSKFSFGKYCLGQVECSTTINLKSALLPLTGFLQKPLVRINRQNL